MSQKQESVVKKIKNSLKHGNEGQLGAKNNDECYTNNQDILNELSYWAKLDKFQGKNIICPCDWDITDDEEIYSITITYKDTSVEIIGNSICKITKSKIIRSNTKIKYLSLTEDNIEDFLRDKLTCNFIRTLAQNARRWGIKSITASGYNPINGKGTPFQDIDYSKYDICITNPPFSLYRKFMGAIVGKIEFLVLAPFLNRCAPCVCVPLMEKTAYLGKGIELHLTFNNPTIENKFNTKIVNCDWITSWPEAQEERNNRHFKSGIKYADYKDEYQIMTNMIMKDGTNPIRVSMSTYPEDYEGWMFGTVGVLDNLDQSSYEWYCTACYGYFNSNTNLNPFNHKLSRAIRVGLDGKAAFEGIVFRKKKIL